MNIRRIRQFLIGMSCAAIPLVTQATCGPNGGFSFFRDDDESCCGYDDGYYYDDVYYYEDCGYYDDCYYEDVIYIEEY